MFSIDGHDLTVIEADGIETEPVTVNAVQIFSAQRYSFVVSPRRPDVFLEVEAKRSLLAHCEPDHRQLLGPGQPELR